MSNFNDQLGRMKDLIKYGTVNEESKPISTYSLVYKAQAADGKYYGIIRENSKYFVKVAAPGKETIAEAYQYIGGINNKTNYEYNSYANALKQFELKLGSINEAYDENRRVITETLDPFKKEDLVIEGTENMKNELARQFQIMRNASVIMNETTEIGSTPFKSQPEAPTADSGNKDYPYTKEGKPEADRGAIKFDGGDPKKHSATFGPDSNDVEDYNLDKGATPTVKNSVASEHPNGGKVARVNESMEECGYGECGLVGEDDEDGIELNKDDEPINTDELNDWGAESEEEGDSSDDDFNLDDESDEFGDEEDDEFDDDDEYDDEEGDYDDDDDLGDDEFDDDDESVDDEDFDFGDEEDDEDFDDEDDDEFDDEPEEGEFDDEEENDDEEDPEIELDENIVRKFRHLVRESINEMMGELGGDEYPEEPEDDSSNNAEGYDLNPDEMDDYNDWNRDEKILSGMENEGFDDELGMDDYSDEDEMLAEAKAAKMNSIVESVVNDILNEDELHVFGDHPGYRKKPMTLPQTGEDKNQWGRDWNDDSVYSEEPFGKGKGDSTPFDQLVSQITDSVMKQVNEDKKKVK